MAQAVSKAEQEKTFGPLLHPTQFGGQRCIHGAIPNDAQRTLIRRLCCGGPIKPCPLGLPWLEIGFGIAEARKVGPIFTLLGDRRVLDALRIDRVLMNGVGVLGVAHHITGWHIELGHVQKGCVFGAVTSRQEVAAGIIDQKSRAQNGHQAGQPRIRRFGTLVIEADRGGQTWFGLSPHAIQLHPRGRTWSCQKINAHCVSIEIRRGVLPLHQTIMVQSLNRTVLQGFHPKQRAAVELDRAEVQTQPGGISLTHHMGPHHLASFDVGRHLDDTRIHRLVSVHLWCLQLNEQRQTDQTGAVEHGSPPGTANGACPRSTIHRV